MSDWEDQDEEIGGINVTPLVDVGLVLVLIFMVAVPLSMIHGIEVKRQALQKYGLTTPQENITVHLTSRQIFILDDKNQEQPIPYEDFGMVFTQMVVLSPSKKVLLRSEREVPHGQTVWVLDLAKQSGAEDLSIMATPMKEGR